MDRYPEILILSGLSKEKCNIEGIGVISEQEGGEQVMKIFPTTSKVALYDSHYSQIKHKPRSDSLWGKPDLHNVLNICFELAAES